jgi:D-lactate dehydrogenase
LNAAQALGLQVVRVPEYSPHAVAEHAVALILTLNRKLHRAYGRVRDANFTLDGLVGFDLYGKTCGVIGTGKIGAVFARIMHGFGCQLVGFDLAPDASLSAQTGLRYTTLDEIYVMADIISLHVPLTPATRHLINAQALKQMKPTAMLVNTGRGALVDSRALIHALKQRRVGAAALDVYEEEEGVFFQNLSDEGLHDDVLARLLTFPNVLITSHQGFLTREALTNIAQTTLASITAFAQGTPLKCAIRG